MRLLFIRTHSCIEKFYFPGYLREPLGILSLATFLKPFCEVRIIDSLAEGWNRYWEKERDSEFLYRGLKPEELLKIIKKFKPNIIGITWLFPSDDNCIKETIEIIKKNKNLSEIKIIVGGPQPSANPKLILEKYPEIDIVVFGEGELTLKELVLEKLEHLNKISGIAYREGDKIILNPPRPRISDLDTIPIPDRELIPAGTYSKQYFFDFIFSRLEKLGLPFKINCFLTSRFATIPIHKFYYAAYNKRHVEKKLIPEADIITARGCPNHCTFCAIHNVWGHQWIARSAQSVIKEIDILVRRYKIKHINIQDDNFNISKERTIEICKGIIKKNYKITLTANSGVYVPTLDEETLWWLKKAGMNLMRFSIESGNQEVLDNIINKKINLSTVKSLIDICKKLKIKTEGAFIFGIPGQTIKAMEDNLKFAEHCGFDRVLKFIYQPFPNTKLYKICEEKGYFTRDFNPQSLYVTGSKCFLRTEDFTPEDVLRLARQDTDYGQKRISQVD